MLLAPLLDRPHDRDRQGQQGHNPRVRAVHCLLHASRTPLTRLLTRLLHASYTPCSSASGQQVHKRRVWAVHWVRGGRRRLRNRPYFGRQLESRRVVGHHSDAHLLLRQCRGLHHYPGAKAAYTSSLRPHTH